GEDHRHQHCLVVGGLGEQRLVVLHADEFGDEAERIFAQEGLPDRLARRPVEEDNGDDELRKQQEIGQQLVIEDGGLFHANPIVIARSGATKQSIYPICGSMDCFASAFALRASADKSLATTSPKCLPYFAVFSKARNMALPLATVSSRACWAVFLPASAA